MVSHRREIIKDRSGACNRGGGQNKSREARDRMWRFQMVSIVRNPQRRRNQPGSTLAMRLRVTVTPALSGQDDCIFTTSDE